MMRMCVFFIAVTVLCAASCTFAQADDVKAGAVLFGKSGCPFCHGPAGMGTDRAPSLRDVHKRLSDEQIKHQIHDGGRMMPPFGEALTEDEIAQLSIFLRAKDAWNLVPPPDTAGGK
jgi:mono/diheme cytochrome c family protein